MRTRPALHRFTPLVLAGLIGASSVALVITPASAATGTAAAAARVAGVACRGAVVQPVTAPILPSSGARFCITVGGVVRVEKLGPGMLTATPRNKVECGYAGGVHVCRLTRAGRVTLAVADGGTVTVTVVKASRPPKPSPACKPKRAVLRLDAANDGPPWWAECMKVGATVRVQSLGPGALRVIPHRAASCRYEAAVHTCRLRSVATVTFIARSPKETRHLTVVAVK